MVVGQFAFKVLLIEANLQHRAILEGRIRQKQAQAGHGESEIKIQAAATLQEAAFILRHDADFDCVYLDCEGIVELEQQANVVRQLRNLVACPIKVVVRDKASVSEPTEDPTLSFLNKDSLSDIDTSLRQLIQQMEAKKANGGNGGSAAIAELKAEVKNLWRELGDLAQSDRDLRGDMQSLQDNTFLRVDDLPVKLADLDSRLKATQKDLDALQKQSEATAEVLAAIKLFAKVAKFVRKHWIALGGTSLIPLAIWVIDMLRN